MVSTTNQMTTPKTQTNFASSKLGNVSSGKKNYHPRENKKYFLSNSKTKQVDWNSKTSSRVKLGLGDRKISEPMIIQPRTFENSPVKPIIKSQSTTKNMVLKSNNSPKAVNSPDSVINNPFSSIISLNKHAGSHQKPIVKKQLLQKHQSTKIFEI